MSHIVVSLTEQIEILAEVIREEENEIGNKSLRRKIRERFSSFVDSSFLCANNNEMVEFLRNDAVNKELYHSTRTYLIFNDDSQSKFLGFFTLAIKDLDISQVEIPDKKALIYSGKSPSNINVAPSYLIAHIAKNDKFSKEFSGEKILEEALLVINEVRKSIGGKLIILDSVCVPRVMELYKQFGFSEIGDTFQSQAEEVLQLMVLPMPNRLA